MKQFIIIFIFVTSFVVSSATNAIRINQIGYLPNTVKVAVFVSTDSLLCSSFTVRNALDESIAYTSNNVVASGSLGQLKTTYRLDFSAVQQPGIYYIEASGVQSPQFTISKSVWDGTAEYLLQYLRQQRCGFNPFFNDSCHTRDGYVRYNQKKEGQFIDVRGGWHDASDLLQYLPTSATVVHDLLMAAVLDKDHNTDQYDANGRPGKNGKSDYLDEALWGLQWMERMNPAPGEMYNQVGDDRDHIGMKIPKNDYSDYGYGPNNGRPVYYVDGKPQQQYKGLNHTTGTASTAGKFASVFALAVYRALIDTTVKRSHKKLLEYITKAEAAYEYGKQHPGNTQTVSVVSPYIYAEDNWADDMELAAIELSHFYPNIEGKGQKYLNEAVEFGRMEPVTPWMGADTANHYQWYPFYNKGHILIAATHPDTAIRNEFKGYIRCGLQRIANRGSEHPFRWGIPGIWCSNNLTAAALQQCIMYRTVLHDSSFVELEAALRDWLFGCNPWGTSMIVGLPDNGVSPRQPHSNLISLGLGTPAGGLVDGPVYHTIFSKLRGVNLNNSVPNIPMNNFEDVQPGDVVYHDNTNDYSTNEPTIDGTAALIFPLLWYAQEAKKQQIPTEDTQESGYPPRKYLK